MTSSSARIAAAVASGYLLGRRRKIKLAIMVGGLLAGKRIATTPRGLLKQANEYIEANPELAKLSESVRTTLMDSARQAAVGTASNRINRLSDTIHERVGKLAVIEPSADGAEGDAEQEAEEEREPDAAAQPDEEEQSEVEAQPDEEQPDEEQPEGEAQPDEEQPDEEKQPARKASAKKAAPKKRQAAKKTAATKSTAKKSASGSSATAKKSTSSRGSTTAKKAGSQSGAARTRG